MTPVAPASVPAQALGIGKRMVAYYEQGDQIIPKVVFLATEGFDKRKNKERDQSTIGKSVGWSSAELR
jgi:hypothetical protein